jgi:hypothetical protein
VNDVFRAAAELQEFCERQHWRFCFIGGIALQRWADPRQTVDADLTLVTGFGEEQTFVDSLLSAFRPRTEGEREDAIHRRVALLFSSEEIALGVALGTLPFEENSVQRASRWQLDDRHSLITCSADDLIVHKAFAARDLDWADVRSIVLRQGRKLNVDQIWSELRPLSAAKEEPEILTKLQRIFDEALD